VVSDRHEEGLSPTLDGSTVGTPAYMSPEQANGELDKIDPRSDIYSLGAILYEILTLERAIEGETPMMLLANAARNRIVPIEKRAAGRHIPRELSAIAMKCLAKSRPARYRSVLDLRRDIALFLEGRSVSAKPDSFAQAIVKLVKRNRPVSASIAAAAVLLLAVTLGFIINLRAERDRARTSERQAVAERKVAQEARDDQRATALTASQNLAAAAIRAADEGRFADADFRANAALEVMPHGPWGHYALGAIAFEKKDFAAARKHLEEAARLDPSHKPSSVFLARVQAASGDVAKWEKVGAHAGQSKDWRALAAAGEALYAAGKYKASYEALRQAVALLDKQPEVPETTKAQVKDEADRSLACVKTEGFPESLRGLAVDEQCKRIVAMLVQIYRNCPIYVSRPKSEGISVSFDTNLAREVRWLDPLKGLPIEHLSVSYSGIRDLAPLKGMPLTFLNCSVTQVADLWPLKGMPLRELDCSGTKVSDLTPLTGMTLIRLGCGRSTVSDLAPLRGMPLTFLDCGTTNVLDLNPLRGMPLKELECSNTPAADLSPLQGMPLEVLRIRHARYPTAVDISPLKGMRLRSLDIRICRAIKDLSVLKGMPLSNLWMEDTGITDVTPLDGMNLETLSFWPKQVTKGIEVVRAMKGLKRLALSCDGPWFPPDEFWRKYDAGELK